MNTTVFWASRHSLNQDQLNGLEKIIDDSFAINQVDRTFRSAEEILSAAGDAKFLAVVLPIPLLAHVFKLKRKDQVILVPKSKRVLIPQEGGESKVSFVYDGWEVIDQLTYVSHVVK